MIGVKPAPRFISPRNSDQPKRFFLCREEAVGVVANIVAPVELEDQNGENGGLNDDEGANTPRLDAHVPEASVPEGDEEVVECQKAQTGPFPFKPRPELVENHRLHHHPYQSWCKWCVEGKAHGQHHESSGRESSVPVVATDYFFLTSGQEKQEEEQSAKTREEFGMADEEIDRERREGTVVKCLIMRCHASKSIFCWVVPYKGDSEDGYVTGLICTGMKWLGWRRMILKCDNEPPLLQLMRSAASLAKVEFKELEQLGEEHPIPYDSQANGAVERT